MSLPFKFQAKSNESCQNGSFVCGCSYDAESVVEELEIFREVAKAAEKLSEHKVVHLLDKASTCLAVSVPAVQAHFLKQGSSKTKGLVSMAKLPQVLQELLPWLTITDTATLVAYVQVCPFYSLLFSAVLGILSV